MVFGIIRRIIPVVILVIGVFIVRKYPLGSRRWRWLFRISLIVLWIAISLVPFEKWIYTFSTAESAFSYGCDGEISHVIEGDNTALVLADGSLVEIIPKKDGGWAMPSAFESKQIHYSNSVEPIIITIKHRTSGECYLNLWFHQNGECDISDSNGSVFLKTDETVTGTQIYGYIGVPDSSYELIIDGASYYLFDEQ